MAQYLEHRRDAGEGDAEHRDGGQREPAHGHVDRGDREIVDLDRDSGRSGEDQERVGEPVRQRDERQQAETTNAPARAASGGLRICSRKGAIRALVVIQGHVHMLSKWTRKSRA